MNRSPVIAHISDLHFGDDNPRVLDSLRDSLLRPPEPDFVVVTGDLSQHSFRKQLQDAKDYLDEIIKLLAKRGKEARYLVIPGNHDVGLVLKRRKAWKSVFSTWGDGRVGGAFTPASLQVYYRNQVTRGDEATAGQLAADARRYCEYYPECQLAFLKFDSNIVGWYSGIARGSVGLPQFRRVKEVTDLYEKEFVDFKNARKIALVHHHVLYLPCEQPEQFLLMKDAGIFWRTMIEWGVELVLHGHKHFATHAVIRYPVEAEAGGLDERELMVLSAGTAASKDLPGNQRNCYYKIECDVFKYNVMKYFIKDDKFGRAEGSYTFRRVPKFHIPGAGPIDADLVESILVPDDGDDDDGHHYSNIAYEAWIDKELGYTMQVTYAGTNLAEGRPLRVPMLVVDAPMRIKSIKFKATDRVANASLHVKAAEHPANIHKLVFEIALPGISWSSRSKCKSSGTSPG